MDTVRTKNGEVTVLDGPEAVRIAALAALLVALRLEARTNGRMQLTRGPSALARAKLVTGLRTRDRAVHIARIEAMLAEQRLRVRYVEENPGFVPPPERQQ